MLTLLLGLIAIILMWYIIGSHSKMQRTIDRQNETIQRLINREPVTYAEVGAKPSKPVRERYAAWGSQMVDIDEEEQRS